MHRGWDLHELPRLLACQSEDGETTQVVEVVLGPPTESVGTDQVHDVREHLALEVVQGKGPASASITEVC